METFKDYAYYYNAFYKDKNYAQEVKQVDALLKKYGNQIGSILNFGCGTGKHDLELKKLGYQCAGVDISNGMIEIARRNALSLDMDIDFTVADIRTYQPDKTWDAVISLFHVMSYQNTNEDVLAVLKAARKSLGCYGIFLFDVWYGPGVLSDQPTVRVKEAEDGENRLIRIARPVMHAKENVVDVCYEALIINKATSITKCISEVHKMRYFFTPELEMLLEEAGFELLENIDCVSEREADYHSWTSYFIARAK